MTSHALHHPWWHNGIIYEIYIRSFCDGSGDGIGDLQGIEQRVDYLSDLGIDAVWLTPFYTSPQADFGYDVSDYCNVDPLYGSLPIFDSLVARLHERNIKTIIDFVPNHSSIQHPWFISARSSRSSPHRDWYIWRDPAPDGGPPNNWLSLPGGPAWTFDETTGQYYLHSFLAEQPDLNWRNAELRAQMMNVLCFWLERGVAGFRVDVLDRIFKDPLLRDDPPNPDYRDGQPDFMRLRSVNSSNQPELMDVIADMRTLLASYGDDRVLIGELYQPVDQLVPFYAGPNNGVQIPFNFNLMWQKWYPPAIATLVHDFEHVLPRHAWPNWVLSNHDQSRIVTRFGAAQAKTAMMLLLTLRGTPTLYQGDELGLADVPVEQSKQQDKFARVGEGGRDAYRTPMPWTQARYGGFSELREPWLPLPPDLAHINAQHQSKEPLSMLNLTRGLIALRRAEPALALGAYHCIEANDSLYVYERSDEHKRFRIILNFTDQIIHCAHGSRHGHIVFSTHFVTPRGCAQEMTLAPHEGIIMAVP